MHGVTMLGKVERVDVVAYKADARVRRVTCGYRSRFQFRGA